MRFINSSFTDAGFNLAAEEYLLKQGTEDVFMLWQSAPSVICLLYTSPSPRDTR